MTHLLVMTFIAIRYLTRPAVFAVMTGTASYIIYHIFRYHYHARYIIIRLYNLDLEIVSENFPEN